MLVAGVAGSWSQSSKLSAERVTVAQQGTEISDLQQQVSSLTEDLGSANDETDRIASESEDLRGALRDCRDAAAGGKHMLTLFAKVGFGRATVEEARAEFRDYRDSMQICTSQANSNGVF